MIKNIQINRFKSFKHVETTLTNFSILVGSNNVGKSNFKQALLLLRALSQGAPVSEALRVVCGTSFNAIYQNKNESYDNIEFKLEVSLNESSNTTYFYSIRIKTEKDDFFIELEDLTISDRLQNNKQLILHNEKGVTRYKEINKADNIDSQFDSHKLAITQLNDVNLHSHFIEFREFLIQMWFFDFDPEAMKENTSYKATKVLYHQQGFNIAGTLYEIKQNSIEAYEAIEKRFCSMIPEIDRIDVSKNDDDSLKLLIFEKGRDIPFSPHNVSDGVLRTLGIITAILSPTPPTLMFLEEVDKGIHFRRVRDIVSLLQSKLGRNDDKKMQVILTTHNPYLIDLINPEQLIILERQQGSTQMQRLSDMKDKMAIIKPALDEGTSLGEIWYRGTLGGVPPIK